MRYYVWRRNDGYINATTYHPIDYVTTDEKNEVKFVILLITEDWSEAYKKILIEREATFQGGEEKNE